MVRWTAAPLAVVGIICCLGCSKQKETSKEVPPTGQVQSLDFGAGLVINFVYIRGGTFMMGTPENEAIRDANEGPPTRVTLTRDFWIGQTEVTQGQYQAVMGTNPSYFSEMGSGKAKIVGEDTRQLPVEKVSWSDAMDFCRKLTNMATESASVSAFQKKNGAAFTLPTEAQWEYACRAGSTTQYCFGNDDNQLNDYAWDVENSKGRTQAVRTRKPNAWGLYDMHGSLWEWCLDWQLEKLPGGEVTDPSGPEMGAAHATRGGSWLGVRRNLRSGVRDARDPDSKMFYIGFRIVAPAAKRNSK